MSSAAGEHKEVVIFSPMQLAESFSAFAVNGGETMACGNSDQAALCKPNKRGLCIGAMVSQARPVGSGAGPVRREGAAACHLHGFASELRWRHGPVSSTQHHSL